MSASKPSKEAMGAALKLWPSADPDDIARALDAFAAARVAENKRGCAALFREHGLGRKIILALLETK